MMRAVAGWVRSSWKYGPVLGAEGVGNGIYNILGVGGEIAVGIDKRWRTDRVGH